MTARFFLFCYNLMQGAAFLLPPFCAKSGCRCLLCIGSRPLNGDIYLMSPLSFSRSSISVPLTFFRSTLSISLSLKDSGASLIGFLSMA